MVRAWSWNILWSWSIGTTKSENTTIIENHSSNSNSISKSSSGTYQHVYEKIIPCLKVNKFMREKDTSKWVYPADAVEHYKMLLDRTRKFRDGIPYHEGPSGYMGPWVENIFSQHFIDRDLSSFNGFIPLFVSWTDIHVHQMEDEHKRNKTIPTKDETMKQMIDMLRPDVLYLTVSQDDQGLFEAFMQARPNVLVLSAGGYGHIPIPLIKGEMNYSAITPSTHFAQDVGFFGNIRPRLSRSQMLQEMQQVCANEGLKTKVHQTPEWENEVKRSKFNLAPRGWGRTSYRLAEIVQLGRIPVYIYDDHPWLPYEGTNLSISSFGFSGQMGRLQQTAKALKHAGASDAQMHALMKGVERVREHYTYEGVMRQIEAFLRDPLGPNGGDPPLGYVYYI